MSYVWNADGHPSVWIWHALWDDGWKHYGLIDTVYDDFVQKPAYWELLTIMPTNAWFIWPTQVETFTPTTAPTSTKTPTLTSTFTPSITPTSTVTHILGEYASPTPTLTETKTKD